MVAVKHFTIFAALIGATMAASTGPAPPSCVASTINEVDTAKKTHLLCDEQGTVKGQVGEKQYTCAAEGGKKDFEADYIVKKLDDDRPSQLQSIVLTNKIDAKKVYVVSSPPAGAGSKQTDYYFSLQGQKSCTIAGKDIEKIGNLVPTGFYVYDMKLPGGSPP